MKSKRDIKWERSYEHSCQRMFDMLNAKMPKVMIEAEARLLLESCHRGELRLIRAVAKHALVSFWDRYCWTKYEWIRVKVFRRERAWFLNDE